MHTQPPLSTRPSYHRINSDAGWVCRCIGPLCKVMVGMLEYKSYGSGFLTIIISRLLKPDVMHTGPTDHQAQILQHHQTPRPPVPRNPSTPGASGGPPPRIPRRECDEPTNPATKGPGASCAASLLTNTRERIYRTLLPPDTGQCTLCRRSLRSSLQSER